MKTWLPITVLLLCPLVLPAEPLRLVGREDHAFYLSLLPRTDGGFFERLKQREVVFYTDREMPRVRWLAGGWRLVDPRDGADANNHFPWRDPAGIQEGTPHLRTVRLWVPPASGAPIRWWREDGHTRWRYPLGTLFGEVLALRDPVDGSWHTFEVRVRTRMDEDAVSHWQVNVYRPFVSPEQLRAAVARLRETGTEALTDALDHPTGRRFRLRNVPAGGFAQFSGDAFSAQAVEEELPPLRRQLVRRLLDETPFRAAKGEVWREFPGGEAQAPTTRSPFHIVPRGYRATFVPVTTESCARCHNAAGRPAQDFRSSPDSWRGRLRGDDGIFSFNPVVNERVARSGRVIHRDTPWKPAPDTSPPPASRRSAVAHRSEPKPSHRQPFGLPVVPEKCPLPVAARRRPAPLLPVAAPRLLPVAAIPENYFVRTILKGGI